MNVFFQDRDPQTNQIRNRFVCELTACNGVTLSAVTANNAAGFPAETFTLTLNDTVLSGVNEDGTSTGSTVSVRGAFSAIRMLGGISAYPALVSCDPSTDTLNVKIAPAEFNFCIPPAQGYLWHTDLGDGRTQINIADDQFMHTMYVMIDNSDNSVLEMHVGLGGDIEEVYRCASDCKGIVVSAPNAANERTVTLTETVPAQGGRFSAAE